VRLAWVISAHTPLELDDSAGNIIRDVAHLEPLNRHRNILNLYDRQPALSSSTYVAPNATVIGSVYAAANTYISFGATVKGDNYAVRLGRNTSIGENCVLECSNYVPDEAFPNSLNIGTRRLSKATTSASSIAATSTRASSTMTCTSASNP